MTLKYYVTTVTNNVTSGKIMLYEPQKHGFLKKIHAFYRSSLLLKIEKTPDYQSINKTSPFFIISSHIQNILKKRLEFGPKLRNNKTKQKKETNKS